MNIPVFVINLKRSVERRLHTTEQLNGLSIPFQLIEAIDGDLISEQQIRNSDDFGVYRNGFHSSYLRKEEIGCALSHLKIFRQIVDEKIELACILEDDNDYSKDFKDLLVTGNLFTADWDILYLGHHSACTAREAQSRNKKQVSPFNYQIGEAIEVPYGAYAYIVNFEAAKEILNIAYPVRIPFDSYIGNAPAIGLRTFLLSPPCVVNSSLFSSTIYLNMNTLYSTPFWKATDTLIRKIYSFFPFLRAIRVWIYVNRRFILRYLRKTGVIKNNYAKI
jgi:glycosyl transferase family 25